MIQTIDFGRKGGFFFFFFSFSLLYDQHCYCIMTTTYSPLWLVPKNCADAYAGAWVESGAQYKKNGF